MTGEIAALAAAACWAVGSLLFDRLPKATTSAGAINLAKCSLGAAALLAATVAMRGRPLPAEASARGLGALALSAVVGLSVGDTAFFASMKALGAARALLLLSTSPVFMVALEAALVGKAPRGIDLAGIALSMAGVALVLWKPSGEPIAWGGVLWGLLAALGQAGGGLLSRVAMQGEVDALSASWFRLAIGALGVAAAGLVGGQAGAWTAQLRQPTVLAKIAVGSLFGTVIGLFLMQWGLAHSRSGGVASALLSLTPAFSLPLSHLTGAERATPRAAAGVLVALGGVAVLLLT